MIRAREYKRFNQPKSSAGAYLVRKHENDSSIAKIRRPLDATPRRAADWR